MNAASAVSIESFNSHKDFFLKLRELIFVLLDKYDEVQHSPNPIDVRAFHTFLIQFKQLEVYTDQT